MRHPQRPNAATQRETLFPFTFTRPHHLPPSESRNDSYYKKDAQKLKVFSSLLVKTATPVTNLIIAVNIASFLFMFLFDHSFQGFYAGSHHFWQGDSTFGTKALLALCPLPLNVFIFSPRFSVYDADGLHSDPASHGNDVLTKLTQGLLFISVITLTYRRAEMRLGAFRFLALLLVLHFFTVAVCAVLGLLVTLSGIASRGLPLALEAGCDIAWVPLTTFSLCVYVATRTKHISRRLLGIKEIIETDSAVNDGNRESKALAPSPTKHQTVFVAAVSIWLFITTLPDEHYGEELLLSIALRAVPSFLVALLGVRFMRLDEHKFLHYDGWIHWFVYEFVANRILLETLYLKCVCRLPNIHTIVPVASVVTRVPPRTRIIQCIQELGYNADGTVMTEAEEYEFLHAEQEGQLYHKENTAEYIRKYYENKRGHTNIQRDRMAAQNDNERSTREDRVETQGTETLSTSQKEKVERIMQLGLSGVHSEQDVIAALVSCEWNVDQTAALLLDM